jgi:REP element-mobilizing transposase RayT
MPNHIHLIIYYSGGQQSLNTIVGNGKRFIAYKIVDRLRVQNETAILTQLTLGVRAKDKSRGKKHEVWQDTFDVKECRTERFVLQKLNYIHKNPCAGKWKLAAEPHHYLHSSCLFYLNGKSTYFRPRDYSDFLGMYANEENAE